MGCGSRTQKSALPSVQSLESHEIRRQKKRSFKNSVGRMAGAEKN